MVKNYDTPNNDFDLRDNLEDVETNSTVPSITIFKLLIL